MDTKRIIIHLIVLAVLSIIIAKVYVYKSTTETYSVKKHDDKPPVQTIKDCTECERELILLHEKLENQKDSLAILINVNKMLVELCNRGGN